MRRAGPLFVTCLLTLTSFLIVAGQGRAAGIRTPRLPVAPGTAAVIFNDWPTYAFDNKRDGFNPETQRFRPQALPMLHLAWATNIGDYNTQTQPILILNVGTHRGVLIAGGASGVLQAFDAFTGARVWSRSLGQQTLSCGGGGSFGIGIGGTAAFDEATGALYVVDSSNAIVNGPSALFVHRIDPATGRDSGRRVDIAPNPLPGELNTAHTSLTLAPNGALYVGTGSTCDISSWRGRVAVVDTRTMTLTKTFFTTYGRGGPYSGGGVWGWGGVSLDANGDVYVGVGNADDGGGAAAPFVNAPLETAGYAERIVETTPWLGSTVASNYPGFASGGASFDLDFTGTPVLATPIGCPTLAIMQGKAGQLVFYDAGGIGAGPVGRYVLSASSWQAAYIGNPAYSPLTELVYAAVPSAQGGSIEPPGMLALDVSRCTPAVAWATAFGADSYALPDTPPRSAPTVTAGGIVFAGSPSAAGGELWALDATNGSVLGGGAPILDTGASIRMAPVVSGNRLWLLDNGGDLYSMTLDPSVPAIANPLRRRAREIFPREAARRGR